MNPRSVLLLALLAGCGGGDNVAPPPRATKLAIAVQPASQAQSGVPINPQPAVQLQDDQGAAVSQAGAAVSVSIASGGGSLLGPTTVNTSSSGLATFTGLGIHGSVGPRSLTFTAPDLTAVTSTTIELSAGAAALIVAGAGNGQTAGSGGPVAVPPSVTITDGDNNPVAGIAVSFQVTAGGGAVEPSTVTSNGDGVAVVTSWTLGAAPGANSLTATADAVPGSSVVFTATASSDVASITGTITTSNALLARSKAQAGTARFGNRALLRSGRFQANDFRSRPFRQSARYTGDELIVTYRPSAMGSPAIRSHVTAHMSAAASTLKGVSPAIMAARVRVQNPGDIANVAAALRRDPAVATVERNGLMSREATTMRLPTRSSSDPYYPFQAWSYGMIDLPEAWAITTGSASVLVGVVDDGIRFDHPGIATNLTSDGYDFVSNSFTTCPSGDVGRSGDGDDYDPDPTIPAICPGAGGPTMFGGHGLHVAGTIGAVGNDGLGVSGINWTVRIRPVRVLDIDGSGTDYDVAQGILYAAGLPADNGAGGTVKAPTGAKVINLSFGGPDPSSVVHDAIIAAVNAGALVVAGAGNEGTADPFYPAGFPEVLSVSAVGPDRELASYSSFGNATDIAAPGGDFADGGDDDPSFGVLSLIWAFSTGTPDYAFAVGTSMAAPHVAGVAALVLAQNPALSVSQLRSRLTDYAVDAGSSGRDDRYGAGIVNARNSLTQTLGPPRQVRARLYDASTGSVVQTVAATGGGSYTFSGVTSGSYRVFAGQDEDGDQEIGLPGRRWGAFGGSATPTSITVTGAGTHHASFAIGRPAEQEPNETFEDASVLPVGGYLMGTTSAIDTDVYRVLIPQQGRYTFEASAVDGACGFALEGDTSIGLYDAHGVLLAANEDIDQDHLNFCSRVSSLLPAGEYQVRVQGHFGGSYRIQARAGP